MEVKLPQYPEITTLETLVDALSNAADINEQNEIWSKVDNPFVSIQPDGSCDLIFIYRGNSDTKKVELISSVYDPSMQSFGQFSQIENDIWIMPIKHTPSDARISFQYLENGKKLDTGEYIGNLVSPPFSSYKIDGWGDDDAQYIAEMPRARPRQHVEQTSLPGIMESLDRSQRLISAEFNFNESALSSHVPSYQDKSRSYWIHIPPTDPSYTGPYKLLIHLDGYETIKRMKAPAIMEQAMKERKIKPTITVYLNSEDRDIEYGCSREAELFADFVADEFVSKIRRDYPRASTDPSDVTIAGFSMGGNGATHIATRHPEVFGNIISQSGSYWMGSMTSHGFEATEGLQHKLEDKHYPHNEFAQQQCFYLNVGQLETGVYSQAPSGKQITDVGVTQVDASEHFAAFLKDRNLSCHFDIYHGDHCFAEWQDKLIDGLVWINQKRMVQYYKDSVDHEKDKTIIDTHTPMDDLGGDEEESASHLKTKLK